MIELLISYTDTMNNTTATVEPGNCSFTECYIPQELIFIREVQIIFLLLYSVVSLTGIVGNLLIVTTVARWDQTSDSGGEKPFLTTLQNPQPSHGDQPVRVQHGPLRHDDVPHRSPPHPPHHLLRQVVPRPTPLCHPSRLPGRTTQLNTFTAEFMSCFGTKYSQQFKL